jgi:hypothetical protein
VEAQFGRIAYVAPMSDGAWQAQDHGEYEGYWDAFDERFRFRASTRPAEWPAIDEPSPSVTFDLSPIYANEGPMFASGATALDSLVLRALTWSFPQDQPFIVLDWQHTSYRFWPHRHAVQNEPWLVTPFPNGDYYAFLTEDFTVGTFGHPWEQTLCVFGAPLLESLAPTLSPWLPVKRSSP